VYFEFQPHFSYVKDPRMGTTLLRGQSENGLYTLPSIPPLSRFALVGERASLDRWHCRLGHHSLWIVSQVVRTNTLATLKNKAFTVCHACWLGKSHELPFHLSSSTSMHPLDLLFTDVWGPSPSPSINGKRYYVCFVDDFDKFTWLFPMAAKSEASTLFLSFQMHVEKLFDCKIKAIQLDWTSTRSLTYSADETSTHSLTHSTYRISTHSLGSVFHVLVSLHVHVLCVRAI